MFGKSKISKSIIDAVNSVIDEEPIIETKKQATTMLSEAFKAKSNEPEKVQAQMKGKKDDVRAALGKSAIAMTAESKKKMLADDELDETGFHMAAHAARKSGASQFEFQGKKYPVTAKSHMEEYELDEEGNCVTPMKAKKIADKEVGKHEKSMHHKEEVEPIEEDRYDDMLDDMLKKDGKRLLAKNAKDIQRHKDINSGKALKQHIKKNPDVLKTYSKDVKRTKKMYGEEIGLEESSDYHGKEAHDMIMQSIKQYTDAKAAKAKGDHAEHERLSKLSIDTHKAAMEKAKVYQASTDPEHVAARKRADDKIAKSADTGHGQGRYMGDSVEMSFKDRLLEKSVSTKQARTMAGVAHNPEFAKKMNIPQSVGKEFNKADKGTKMLSRAMKGEEVELDEKDELRGRIGTNIVNKKPREGQTDLRNIPVGNRPDSKNKFSQGERDSQPTRLKNDIKASLGKHTKPNLPEEMEVTESLKDVAKKILSKVGGGSDKDQLKRLQKNMGMKPTGEKPMKKEEVELDETENPFTSYKDKTKPSIFAPKSHTAKKTDKGTMYTKNWSKKDQKSDDEKPKNEAVDDKEHEKHVRIDGETDMKTKTVDTLRGRVKVPADYHNKSKSYKVGMTVGEGMVSEEHDDEKEDKALIRKEVPKIVKDKALKKSKKKDKVDGDDKLQEAFKGPEAGSGTGDHPFVTAEAKPLMNARELAKKTMHRIKNEMLGKISN